METKHKNFKPYDRVLVKFEKEGAWVVSIYSHWDEDLDVHNTLSGIINDDDILPFEGNEDLLGKVGNPTPKKWRAKKGYPYWHLCLTKNGLMYVVTTQDDYLDSDNNRYANGNYFRTEEQAKEKIEQIKQIWKGE